MFAQTGRQSDVVSLVGETACQHVDPIRFDGVERYDDTDCILLLEHQEQVVDRAEHLDTTTLTQVVAARESHDSVSERRIALVGMHQTDRVGIGSNDDDASAEASFLAEAGEDRAGDPALEEEHTRHAERHRDHPEPGQVVVLDGEGDEQQVAQADSDSLHDVEALLETSLVRSCLVEPVEPGSDRKRRQTRQHEDEMVGDHESGDRLECRLDAGGEDDADDECSGVRAHEASAQHRRDHRRRSVVEWLIVGRFRVGNVCHVVGPCSVGCVHVRQRVVVGGLFFVVLPAHAVPIFRGDSAVVPPGERLMFGIVVSQGVRNTAFAQALRASGNPHAGSRLAVDAVPAAFRLDTLGRVPASESSDASVPDAAVDRPAGVDVSVVIPTFNRRDRLLRVLEALGQQIVDTSCGTFDFEVVVVSDGSTDGTGEAVREQDFPFPVRLVEQRNAGPAAAAQHRCRDRHRSPRRVHRRRRDPGARLSQSARRTTAWT